MAGITPAIFADASHACNDPLNVRISCVFADEIVSLNSKDNYRKLPGIHVVLGVLIA